MQPKDNLNPFRITSKFGTGESSTSVCCSPNFAVKASATVRIRPRYLLALLLGRAVVTAELKVECTDPELTALIDAYTSRRVREWQERDGGPDAA